MSVFFFLIILYVGQLFALISGVLCRACVIDSHIISGQKTEKRRERAALITLERSFSGNFVFTFI